MDNLAQKYNRLLLLLTAISPFTSYLIWSVVGVTSARIMQLLSYVGVILLIVFSSRDRPIRIPKYLVFYLLFILYVFYSAFVQLDRDFKVNYLFSNKLIGGFNMLLIIENTVISKKFIKDIFKVSKYVLFVAFLVIIYQQAVDNNFYMNHNEELDKSFLAGESKIRLRSIYTFAGYLTMGFGFVPVVIWVTEKFKIEGKNRVVWLLIGMAIIYSFLTKSRWVMLNTMMIFAILVLHHRNRIGQVIKLMVLIPMFGILSYFTLNAVGVDVDKILNDRILESDKTSDHKSATTRLLAFKVFDKLYWNNPVFGVGSIKWGMGGTGQQDYQLRRLLGDRSSQIHVGYLSVLYMYGAVGGFFFFSFMFLLMQRLYHSALRTKIWAPFLGFMGFVFANLTLVTFSVFEMGLIIVFLVHKYYSEENYLKLKEV